MVSAGAGYVARYNLPALIDDKDASLLESAALDPALAKALSPGTDPVEGQSWGETRHEGIAQARSVVRGPAGIGQQNEGQILGLHQVCCFQWGPVAYGDELSAGRPNGGGCLAQLRKGLDAKQSAKVPDEGQDQGLVRPQRCKRYRLALRVEDCQIG